MLIRAQHLSRWFLLGSGLVLFAAPSEWGLAASDLAAGASGRAEADAAKARATKAWSEQVAEHLQCTRERDEVLADVRARRDRCESEHRQYDACRAALPPLAGPELLGCGLGLAVGLAAGGIAQPWSLGECGVASPPESRAECAYPKCEQDPAAIEQEVLAARGLPALPDCEMPSS